MSSPGRAAVDVPIFGCTRHALTAWCARNVPASRSECFENRVELLNHFFGASDHHAITAFKAPHTATGPDVYIVNALLTQLLRTADVIFEIRITSINDDVPGLHTLTKGFNGLFGGTSSRHHKPSHARCTQLFHEVV